MNEGSNIISIHDKTFATNTQSREIQVVFPYRIALGIHDISYRQYFDHESLASAYRNHLFPNS